jgi:hypothetical protein
VLDLPFVLIYVLLSVTVWRAYELWTKPANTRALFRQNSTKQLLLWLWDIPTSVELLLLTLTIYRAKQTYSDLKNYVRKVALISLASCFLIRIVFSLSLYVLGVCKIFLFIIVFIDVYIH